MKGLLGALEAGGTKMVCAVGKGDGRILEQVSIPTTMPDETIPKILSYFADKDIDALGIGAFGPVDVNSSSEHYGCILETPKIPWRHYNIRKAMADGLDVPVGIDTDVNGSCLGEVTYGGSKGLKSVLYLTVGTGIGAGILIDGKPLHGMLHPEAGHVLLRRHPEDTFEGICPNHGACAEGMACGPAIEQRWGKKAAELKDNDKVWEMEAYYIAQALVDYIMVVSPERIILGGGVMHQEQLFPLIRRNVKELINGYLDTPQLKDLDSYIVPASLHGDQGLMGCLRLAELALGGSPEK